MVGMMRGQVNESGGELAGPSQDLTGVVRASGLWPRGASLPKCEQRGKFWVSPLVPSPTSSRKMR